jgi:hypothetical protein
MIRNDQELAVVREQMRRAEAALDSLRHDVLPRNPDLYRVMAEPCLDTIVELRGQIDAYLGIATVPETADIVIALEGERVSLGNTSAASVTRFIDTFRRGLQSAVEILEASRRPDTARRRPRWIESICDLPLVGTSPGSVKILLGEPPARHLFQEEHRQSFHKALELLFDGLAWADMQNADSPQHPFHGLNSTTRHALLAVLTRLLPPSSGEIERVSFLARGADSTKPLRRATLTRQSRARIREEIEALAIDTAFAELEGAIRSVDLDSQTFVLRNRPDSLADLPCEYGPDLVEAVKASLDCRVLVAGTLETSAKTNKSKLLADSIELLGVEPDGVDPDAAQPDTAHNASLNEPQTS